MDDLIVQYSNLGFSLIPVHPRSKVTELDEWKSYQRRRPDVDQLREWFGPNGTSLNKNVAIICGAVSGGLRVVDFDSRDAAAYCFKDIPELAKHTPVVQTGKKGYHVYTRQKGGGSPKSTKFAPRMPVDIQGEGKYVIAPPSVHQNGNTYRFLDQFEGIMEISDQLLLADLEKRAEEFEYVQLILPHWKEGGRQDVALSFAKILRKAGFGEDRAVEIVERICRVKNDPEVRQRIDAVRSTFQKEISDTAAYETLSKAEPTLYPSLIKLIQKRKVVEKSEAAQHTQYVVALMEKFHFATMEDTEEVYIYRDGFYRPNGASFIRSQVERMFQEGEDSASKRTAEEVVDAIRRRTYTDRNDFNPPGKLCLKNGVFDLTELTLSPHSPDLKFTRQLPIKFDPSADCPLWKEALSVIMPKENHRSTLKRWFGYHFQPGQPHQNAFMAVGTGNNGKSTVLGILADMIGEDNIATETLQTLSSNRFAAGRLWDKLANICADIPDSIVQYTGTFKELTGGDWMRGEEKFRAAFNFRNPAKLTFSANSLPAVNDRTRAFWRRWILLPFPVDLEGKEDKDLPAKLRAELPGIFNWALEGLKELLSSGKFEADISADSLAEEWKKRADNLYWFIQECTEVNPKRKVLKSVFFSAYAIFCEANSTQPLPQNTIGGRLPELVPNVTQKREPKGVEGRPFAWHGIGLNAKGLSLVELINKDPDNPDNPDTDGQKGVSSQGCRGCQGGGRLLVNAEEEDKISKETGLPKHDNELPENAILSILKSARGEYIEQSVFMLSSTLRSYGHDMLPDSVKGICDRLLSVGKLRVRNEKYSAVLEASA